MYLLCTLVVLLIYLCMFFSFDIIAQKAKMKINLDFSFFCLLYAFFCLLTLMTYIQATDESFIIYISYIQKIFFPLAIFSLLSFSINAQKDSSKKIYKYIKVICLLFSVIVCIINSVLILFDDSQIEYINNVALFNSNIVSTFFLIITLYFFITFSIIIFLLFVLNANAELERDKKSSSIVVTTISIFAIYVFFINIILPSTYNVFVINCNTFIGLLPILGIYISIKKFDFCGVDTGNLLVDALANSPESVCLIYDTKIKYVNKKFSDMFGYTDKNSIVGKEATDIFPVEFTGNEEFVNKVFSIKKYNLSEKINILCNKLLLYPNLSDNPISILTFIDISFIKQSQEKIEHINKNLKNIIKERTKKLEDVYIDLNEEMKKRIQSENKMLLISSTDALTGLYNRRYFSQFVHEILSNSNPRIHKHLVGYLDLDNFKAINDTLGHSFGDKVLQEVANKLKMSVPEDSIIARIGGDEFLIFVRSQIHDPSYLIPTIGNMILKNMKEPIYIEGNVINTTTSIGFSVYPDCGKDIETLIKNADIAMYKAKDDGKNTFSVFEKEYQKVVKTEFDLTNDMIRAMDNDEFKVFYQPKVEVCDNEQGFRIFGFEALIRWFHPEKGLVSPGAFIPIAEKSGFISEIGTCVLEKACKQIALWDLSNMDKFNISINFSSPKFERDHIYESISSILNHTDLDPSFLQLEITEKYLVKNIDESVSTLKSVNDLGVKILIDDFGTEYSSLNYLKYLPINAIKVDMSFIKGIGKNKKDEAIIIALIKFCENTDIDIIAEGVETKEQFEFLKSHGVKKMQGYYFYKPMSPEDLENFGIMKVKTSY